MKFEYYGWDDGTSLYHFGILGQKWGVRRYQNPDGTLTEEGKKRYRRDAAQSMRKNGRLNHDQYSKSEYIQKIINSNKYDLNEGPNEEYRKYVNNLDKQNMNRALKYLFSDEDDGVFRDEMLYDMWNSPSSAAWQLENVLDDLRYDDKKYKSLIEDWKNHNRQVKLERARAIKDNFGITENTNRELYNYVDKALQNASNRKNHNYWSKEDTERLIKTLSDYINDNEELQKRYREIVYGD